MDKPKKADDLNLPVLLVCPPYENSFNNKQPNNPDMSGKEKIDYEKAFRQWLNFYKFLSRHALVYILPNEGNYQDQIYVANIGVILTHLKEPVFVGSNFTSPPRRGEEKIGLRFFEYMHYASTRCPYRFEGEADCKFIRQSLYVAGYGVRSDLRSYHWMEEQYDCQIISMQMVDERLYHFDCMCFPINGETAIVTVSKLQPKDIKRLEKYISIVEMPEKYAYEGMTNLVRVGNYLLCRDLPTQPKMFFDNMCYKLGMTPVYFPFQVFDASSADISCCVMHITRIAYEGKKIVPLGMQVKEFLK